jgi:natural product precursor
LVKENAMKKVVKKLALSKETLRALEESEIRVANGGNTWDCSTSCFTTTCGTVYC